MTEAHFPSESDTSLLRKAATAPDRGVATVGERLVYAVGDIHGRYDLLIGLLGRLSADAAESRLGARAILIFCGDYVDRGPQSAKVVEALLWLQKRAAFELRFLKGNHEQALLDFLEDPEGGRAWLDCGGIDTLQSYGLHSPEPGQSLAPVRDQLLDVLPSQHLNFLRDLKLTTSVGDFLFVHAGLRPGRPVSLQSQEDMLWIREDFTRSEHRFKRVIVHGHSWSSAEPEVRANRIGVDTGAYRTGVLTALRLEGAQIQFISFAGKKAPLRSDPDGASGARASTAATGEMEWQARAETRDRASSA